jgi:hypothetical protein
MNGPSNSFDEIVTEEIKLRPRSEFTWYGKAEIKADGKIDVRIFLLSPAGSFEFDRDLNSKDLVLLKHHRGVRIEKDKDPILLHIGGLPFQLHRFAELAPRLVETFLTPTYRKKLLDGLAENDPEAIRWAIVHKFPVWRETKIGGAGASDWQEAIPAYAPFEYEER